MTELDHDPYESANDGSLEQLQADDTLIDRGVDDVLDEGYIAPDHWSALQGYGNVPSEMRQRETIALREPQEEREIERPSGPWNPDGEDREVGAKRSGRLVDARDGSGEAFGADVGIDGGAASAEEAAMHVIELDGDDDE